MPAPSPEAIRRYYAQLVCFRAGVFDPRIVDAFATVQKEAHLGPGPWRIPMPDYIETPSDDLAFLYQNVAVGIAPERRINCGEPQLHAYNLSQLKIAPGDSIVQIGAGVGYYTAILGHLTGPSGTVTAYEIESDLAQRAAANLNALVNVTVVSESAVASRLPQADVIYANAAATHPPRPWLDALKPSGRLLFPLAGNFAMGGMLLITRKDDRFRARFICPAAFIACIGAQDEGAANRLSEAFGRGDYLTVQSLRLDSRPDDSAWVTGDGWWLSRAA